MSRRYLPEEYSGPRPEAYAHDAAYEGVPNWDIGRPQRAFVRLVEAGLVRGPVLDVGCGTGELSLFLARQGYGVLGVDISPRAIATARETARWRRNPVRFAVRDALALDGLARAGFQFGTVVDCATFHVLRGPDRDRYVTGLATVLAPDGLFCALGDARPDPRGEYGISPAELRARFRVGDGWRVAATYETTFERRYSRNRAYLGLVRRVG